MPATLTVLDGLHAGAHTNLPPGIHVVGSAEEDDVVLLDDGVGPNHVRLTIDADGIAVAAAAGDCAFDEGPELSEGDVATTADACVLTIGGVRMALDPGASAWSPACIVTWSVATIAVAAVAWGLFPAQVGEGCRLVGACGAVEPPTSRALTEMEARGQDGSVGAGVQPIPAIYVPKPDTGGPDREAAQPPSPATFERDLADAVARHDLTDLNYASEPGVIRFEGDLPPASMGRLRDLQQWLDAQYPGLVLDSSGVVALEAEPTTPPLPRVSALWHVGQPYALVEGQRYGVGETLEDGWLIDGIGDYDVILRHGERRVTVRMD